MGEGGLVNDDELRAALIANVDRAFEALVLAYQRRVYAFALSLCSCHHDAEEVAQDTFVRAYRALKGYPYEQVDTLALKPWLFRIAVNVLRNRLRVHRTPTVSLDAIDDDEKGAIEPSDDTEERPEAVLVVAEQSSDLGAIVATLPPRYREPLVLRHVHGFTYGEIALMTARPEGTVKSDVHRGVRLLRTALEQRGWNGIHSALEGAR